MTTHRGRHIETGEWVYGYLIGKDAIVGKIVEWNDEYFNTEFWYLVDPKTIGRNSEMKMSNGNEDFEIYQGDIFVRDGYYPFFIDFENGSFVTVPCNLVQRINHDHLRMRIEHLEGWSKVGNIHDSPEYLEEDK